MNALVFGGRGALGAAVVARLTSDGYSVFTPPHEQALELLPTLPELNAVVWAQGVNASDSVLAFNDAEFARVMDANVTFIAQTLTKLVTLKRLARPARLCILSSIWQEFSRDRKFSYTVSKAALAGLVRSSAADLGPYEVLINAVLPGVVDTPMSRSQLTSEQMASITEQCPLRKLPSPEDVAMAVSFLVGPCNGAITGQSLPVDAGFSAVRHL